MQSFFKHSKARQQIRFENLLSLILNSDLTLESFSQADVLIATKRGCPISMNENFNKNTFPLPCTESARVSLKRFSIDIPKTSSFNFGYLVNRYYSM